MASSMLRGFLRIVVLKALGEGGKTGYSLMKYVEERIGAKPSPGSMYPLLETLKKEGLVEQGAGKSKEYRLTKKGRNTLKLVEEKRNECLCSLIGGMRMISALTGEDMGFPMAMVESIKKGIIPFREINPEWDRLRNELFVMMKKGELKQKAGKVKKTLAKACREIRKA